jgi:hypothetical protein
MFWLTQYTHPFCTKALFGFPLARESTLLKPQTALMPKPSQPHQEAYVPLL